MRCSDAGDAYFAQSVNGRPQPAMEHLTCFAPGMMLLGDAAAYGDVALAALDTCLRLYTDHPSLLGAEAVAFDGSAPWDAARGACPGSARRGGAAREAPSVMRLLQSSYGQRPEARARGTRSVRSIDRESNTFACRR